MYSNKIFICMDISQYIYYSRHTSMMIILPRRRTECICSIQIHRIYIHRVNITYTKILSVHKAYISNEHNLLNALISYISIYIYLHFFNHLKGIEAFYIGI